MSQLNKTMQVLGLDESMVRQGVVNSDDLQDQGTIYLSTRPEVSTLIRPTMVTLPSLEKLQALVGTTELQPLSETQIPAPWPVEAAELSPRDLDGQQEALVYQALIATLTGHQEAVKSYAGILEKRFFPMQLGVFAAEDIVVQAGQKLIIEPQGHDPVVVTCNSITLEPGAQIVCEAPVIMTVDTFVKKNFVTGSDQTWQS